MTETPYGGLTQLGRPAGIAASPDEALIEKVPNPEPDHRSEEHTSELQSPC